MAFENSYGVDTIAGNKLSTQKKSAIGELESELDILSTRISVLEDKLVPVLGHGPKNGDSDSPDIKSPVNQLREIADQLHRQQWRLQYLIDRIDL